MGSTSYSACTLAPSASSEWSWNGSTDTGERNVDTWEYFEVLNRDCYADKYSR